MKRCGQPVRRIIALLALAAFVLLFVTGPSSSVQGPFACCWVLVAGFLVALVAAPQLCGWQSQVFSPPQESFLSLIVARPPPSSLA